MLVAYNLSGCVFRDNALLVTMLFYDVIRSIIRVYFRYRFMQTMRHNNDQMKDRLLNYRSSLLSVLFVNS